MSRRPHNSGSIFFNKSRGRWVAQLDVSDPRSGKGRVRRSKTATTKKGAHEALRTLEAEYLQSMSQAAQKAPASESVATFLERWFTARQPAWSPRTTELYRHQLDHLILPRVGHHQLAALKPLDIQRMMDDIVAAGHIPSANKCRRMLYTALKQAVRWELIPKNPVEAVDPIPERRAEQRLWTEEEAARFIDATREHRLFAAFFLLLSTGLRRGELLGLRWSDIADDGVYVTQTNSVVNNRAVVGKPKTRRSRRYVPLAPDALDILHAHRSRQEHTKALLGPAYAEPDLVFPSETGTLMHPRNFYRSWRHAIDAAGVPHTRIHDIRHLNVTLLIQCGEDPKVIADRVGHASTAFTLDRYGQVFQAHRKRAARTLSELLASGAHPTNTPRVDGQPSDSDDRKEP